MSYFPKVCVITRKVTETAEKSRKVACFPETYPILCFPVTRDPQMFKHGNVPKLKNGMS